MKERFLYIGNTRHCTHILGKAEDIGENKAILALHGFTGCGRDFAPIAERTPKTKWYAPDFLGHGQSDSPEDRSYYSLNHALNALKRIHDELVPTKSFLLGYSMGGRIALHLANRYPELFYGVILIGSSPGIKDIEAANKRMVDDCALADRILKIGIARFNDEWSQNALIATQKNIPLAIRLQMERWRKDNNPRGLANSLRSLGAGNVPSLWHKLETIRLPVFLVTGQDDIKFTNIAREMLTRLPFCKMIQIPNAGHAAHLENLPYFSDFLQGTLCDFIPTRCGFTSSPQDVHLEISTS